MGEQDLAAAESVEIDGGAGIDGGITTTRTLQVSVMAHVQHMTADAARAHVEVAKATHVAPVRTVMRYMFASVVVLICFMLLVAFATQWNTTVALAVVLVAGAAVAAPLGIILSKIANRILPPLPGPKLPPSPDQ